MQSRRSFVKRTTSALALLPIVGSTIATVGCSNIYSEILSYAAVGVNAFQSVVDILAGAGVINPAEGTLIDTVIALVKAAFADISATVQAYQSAPAAQKTTLLGKISTAISVAMAQIQTFWNDLKIPDPKMASLVQGLLGIILSTLAGFQTQLPTPVATPAVKAAESLPNKVQVTPKKLTPAEFKKEFNNLLDQNGQGQHKIY